MQPTPADGTLVLAERFATNRTSQSQ